VSTADAADGTFVVLVVAAIWAYALAGKRGTIPGRLMGIVAFVIVAWLLLGGHNASGGMAVASGTLRGLSAVLSAFTTLLTGH
jgi:fructose-specific phosphotransferase system IIC component